MKIICAVLVLSLLAPVQVFSGTVALGVLESPQCKKQRPTSVRLLFAKSGTKWVPLNNKYKAPKNFSPTKLTWTVALDGKALGTLLLNDPNPSSPTIRDWFYGRDKLYTPESNGPLPAIPNRQRAFAGWCEAPEFRPLVVVSQPNYVDPENWKPFAVPETYKKKLLSSLRLTVGIFNAYRCESAPSTEPWDFGSDDLIIYKGYRSSTRQELVSIGLNTKLIGCDGLPPPQWSGNWFLLTGERISFLGTEMEFVDAGDYDGDGRSELLFWRSGYNRDGYVLVYDQLQQKTEYVWGYH